MFKLYVTRAVWNDEYPYEETVRITDDYPTREDMIAELVGMGYAEADIEKVRNGGPRDEITAANGDGIQWSDTEYRGPITAADLSVPVDRLDRIVESIKEVVAGWIDSGMVPDTVLFWHEVRDDALGGLTDDENMDIEGDDLFYIHWQVENWLWDGRPMPSRGKMSGVSETEGPGAEPAEAKVEYGVPFKGGGWNLRPDYDGVENDYPLADYLRAKQRFGGEVYRRRVIVVSDWEKVEPGAAE